jgi:AmmeMemoRadiSam system protein B
MDGSGLHTPLGTMALDSSAAELLAAAGNRIRLDYGPHCGEHSAENQVPFVQSLFPSAGLVAALVGDHDIQTLRDLVDALGKLAERRSILVVSSSDMLHDADYELVSRTDRETLKKVAAMDYDSLAAEWSPYRQTFCGLIPALAAMRFAASRGCREGTVLHYCNSGDIDPSGRGTWVVGYGAVVFAVPAQSG